MELPSHSIRGPLLLTVLLLAFGFFTARIFLNGDNPGTRSAKPNKTEKAVPGMAQPAGLTSRLAGVGSRALYSFVPAPANAAEIETRLIAPTKRIYYVRLDQALIAGKRSPFWRPAGEGRFDLPLPDGRFLPVVIEHSELTAPHRFSSLGHLDGQPGSRAIFAYNNGVLQAMVEDGQLNRFTIRYCGEGATQFFQVDPTQIPPCGGALRPVLDGDALTALARSQKSAATTRPLRADMAGAIVPAAPVGAMAGAAGVVVDVLMAYTSAVRVSAGGTTSADAAMDLAIATMNSDLARSQCAARVRLAGTTELSYANDDVTRPSANWLEVALEALRRTSDGKLDTIHALRDQYGADLVCLALNRPDSTGTIGIAYILNTPNDRLDSLFAFATVEFSYMGSSHVVSHELGHTLGCAHARGDSGTTGTNDGAYSYSYGYRSLGLNGLQFRTIMAYAPGSQVGYYSNPDVVATEVGIAVPMGVPIGQVGETNNALTIDRDAFEVASYRPQAVASYAGTMINVSTRAFVGTGEQQLIGGFVVQGTQPKKILCRAVGPSLTAYGVTGAIADPKLTLFRLGAGASLAVQVGFNDNWSEQSGAADVSSTAATVGAFALPSGSKDAAIILTLDPGSYTANIEGVANTTGIALVEAYDAGVIGARVVNLSTRGYADKGREMIGGFVVQGDPAQPKRILIRVLGPTLTNYGVNGVLNDPFMSVYDAHGNLLVQNDDWDPPTSTINGEVVMQRGVVDLQMEKLIQATGLAPSKPVEPAIIFDLLPGAYTVIVEPFESLPDQPAEPGVGIVEVYELSAP